jgi:Dolichyl-phosphate-mannose-protein mannosyltransferase
MKKEHVLHYLGLAVLFLVYLATLRFVRPWGDFPLNDDWIYSLDCVNSAREGRLVLGKYESAWSFPQLVVGTLIARFHGFSFPLFRLSGVVSLLAIVLMMDVYLRRVGLASPDRLIAAATLVFNPVVYALSLTFMTDLPFLALWLAACYAWEMGFLTRRRSWLIIASLTTVAAMAQRQFALCITVAALLLLFVHVVVWPHVMKVEVRWSFPAGDFRREATVYLVATLVFFVLFFYWWRSIGGYMASVNAPQPNRYRLLFGYRSLIFLAISTLPLLITLGKPYLPGGVRRFTLALALVLILPLLVFFATGASPLLFGNLFSQFGLFDEDKVLLGRRPIILGPNFNRLACILGIIGLALAVPRLVSLRFSTPRFERLIRPRSVTEADLTHVQPDRFGFVPLLAGLLLLCIFVFRGVYFDRYLLPALVSFWIWIARIGSRNSARLRAIALALVLVFAGVSVTLVADYFRWNEARWAAAEMLVSRGVPADAIHAGYEWCGWHDATYRQPLPDPSGYKNLVAFSADFLDFEVVETIPWPSIWPPRKRLMYVLQRTTPRPEKGRG